MTAQPYASPRTGRAVALCFIVAVHVLVGVAMIWTSRVCIGCGVEGKVKEMAVTFVTVPGPKSQPPPKGLATAPPQRPRQQARTTPLPTISLIPAAPALAPAAPAPAAPAAESIEATPVTDGIVAQAKKDVGKIDRELRSRSLDDGLRNMQLQPGRFERAISGTHRDRGPSRMVGEVLSDGTRRTRVGSMCAQKESNGLVGARDVFRDGIKTKWSTCPN